MKFLRDLAALDKAHPLVRAHHEDLSQQLLPPSLFVKRNRASLNNLPQIDELLDIDNTNAVEDRHAMMAKLFAALLARALDGDIGCTRSVKIASRSSTTLPFSTCVPAELRSGQLAGSRTGWVSILADCRLLRLGRIVHRAPILAQHYDLRCARLFEDRRLDFDADCAVRRLGSPAAPHRRHRPLNCLPSHQSGRRRFGRDHCGLLQCRCAIRDGYADGAVHSRVTRGTRIGESSGAVDEKLITPTLSCVISPRLTSLTKRLCEVSRHGAAIAPQN
jgi:hypothetical protein